MVGPDLHRHIRFQPGHQRPGGAAAALQLGIQGRQDIAAGRQVNEGDHRQVAAVHYLHCKGFPDCSAVTIGQDKLQLVGAARLIRRGREGHAPGVILGGVIAVIMADGCPVGGAAADTID